ncbi:MAG: hypothetical protein ACRCU2_01180, partial [Planktothrix sp.]
MRFSFHYEALENYYNFRVVLTPRYFNWCLTKHSGINTPVKEFIGLIRWDLSEYRDHVEWVKKAWFDNSVNELYTINQPYDI